MKSKVNMTILVSVLVVASVFAHQHILSSGKLIANQFKIAENPRQVTDIGPALTRFNQDFNGAVQKAAERQLLYHKMSQQVTPHLTPHQIVPQFFKTLDRAGHTEAIQQKLNAIQAEKRRSSDQQDGGISGRVMVNGIPPQDDVNVFAFDRHGYFAGLAGVSRETGDYTITGLPSDSFYVVSRSEIYVDQIYKNVPAALGSMAAWRQAEKVFVPQAIVSGIDFNLNPGVTITGSITDDSGTPIEDGLIADLVVTTASSELPVYERSVETFSGTYTLVLPAIGQFKIQATVEGYEPAWHLDQAEWINASVIEITDFGASPVVNFKLKKSSQPPTGEITGTVNPPGLVIVAAFDVRDTSFVQLGLTLGSDFTIPDLPAGQYFVFANDFLASQIQDWAPGLVNARGAFYDGAAGTPELANAKPVSVTAGQITENINITLATGAILKGRVTDFSGASLDSLTLVVLNADVLSSEHGPFLSRLELHVFSTDADGNYELPGLRTGEYLLRTLSDFTINLADSSIIRDGKHKGKVVDQFYGGETNLFRILEVEPLVFEMEETFVVDLMLGKPHYITGTIKAADNQSPVTKALIAALEDTSGYPVFPFGAIDSLGSYSIGPLPQGQYKVVALTGFMGDDDYLTEYYTNQRSFYDASVVNLNTEFVTGINFMLEKGATIQGYIDLLPGPGIQRAGDDKMSGMPVVVFDAESGTVASYDFVQFNGGYKVNRLLPGNYKVATVPQPSEYATTYLGGGDWFADATNAVVSLNFGETTADHIIELEKAQGTITGTVKDSVNGQPLSSIFIGVYDMSGHLVGYDLTDYDPATGQQTSTNGTYSITGLRAGSYYVRTVAIFNVLPLVDDVLALAGIFDNFDLLGFLFGGTLPGFSLDLGLYKDVWHINVPATITVDLDELLFQASAYGLPPQEDEALLPIYLPLPFYESVPTNATMVQVEDGGSKTVDFVLAPGDLNNLITDVETEPAMVSDFQVEQNYPNPFNPSTTITFSLSTRQDIQIIVFDMLGRQVKRLADQSYDAGRFHITWDGRDALGTPVSAGLYIARVSAGEFEQSIKMLMIK
ncbi:T9SS C-terminal target domain-containing protein [candidate division KSB1 bacterium]|nr:T9SS type A sorting domain-containing protein [candidate division KSB1 bacterium]RQW06083.1 MAG: T9SS C-terminal target domain-containing protein [candidate division KSB1 bacterium]